MILFSVIYYFIMNLSFEKAVTSAKNTANEILKISPEDLLNGDGFSAFISILIKKTSREKIYISLKSIYKNLNTISDAELHCFISSEENPLEEVVEYADKIISDLKNFSFQISSDQVLTRALSLHQDLNSLEEKLRFCIADCILAEYFAKKIDALEFEKEEISAELSKVKKIASSEGAKELSTYFRNEAYDLGALSYLWFMGVGLSLALCLIQVSNLDSDFDMDSFKKLNDSLLSYYFFHKLTLKLFILGICASLFFWCGKNFMATRHQATVNKERANILRTFLKFSESTTDPRLRNLVLREAVRSAFSPSHSGYISQKDCPNGNQSIASVFEKTDGLRDKE